MLNSHEFPSCCPHLNLLAKGSRDVKSQSVGASVTWMAWVCSMVLYGSIMFYPSMCSSGPFSQPPVSYCGAPPLSSRSRGDQHGWSTFYGVHGQQHQTRKESTTITSIVFRLVFGGVKGNVLYFTKEIVRIRTCKKYKGQTYYMKKKNYLESLDF